MAAAGRAGRVLQQKTPSHNTETGLRAAGRGEERNKEKVEQKMRDAASLRCSLAAAGETWPMRRIEVIVKGVDRDLRKSRDATHFATDSLYLVGTICHPQPPERPRCGRSEAGGMRSRHARGAHERRSESGRTILCLAAACDSAADTNMRNSRHKHNRDLIPAPTPQPSWAAAGSTRPLRGLGGRFRPCPR